MLLEDLCQRRSVSCIRDRESVHRVTDDDPHDGGPSFGVPHPDEATERADGRLPIPSHLLYLVEQYLHIGAELSKFVRFDTVATSDLFIALCDALPELTLVTE